MKDGGYMAVLTFEEAKRLSIKKWEYYIEHPLSYKLTEDLPELKGLINDCGLCEFYFENCDNCPLFAGVTFDRGCCYEFQRWGEARDNNKERSAKYWARKLLEKIKMTTAG